MWAMVGRWWSPLVAYGIGCGMVGDCELWCLALPVAVCAQLWSRWVCLRACCRVVYVCVWCFVCDVSYRPGVLKKVLMYGSGLCGFYWH